MATVNDLLAEAEERMKKAVEAVRKEMAGIRTGRANPALVEGVTVDYYGVPTPLRELATITVPEARILLIQPWDRNALPVIEKALLRSDLGITPSNDGRVIRVVLPPLSEERRRELVRVVRKKAEDGRVAIRNVRRDILDRLRTMERNKEISQDELRRAQDRLQKVTDAHIEQVDRLAETKEAEVLEV